MTQWNPTLYFPYPIAFESAKMSILEHNWGRSPAQDRVWSQVVGLRPSQAARRLLMVFQAYIDDSVSDTFSVFAGHVASAEAWANFTKDWEELLPASSRDKNGNFNFKMSQMAINSERLERVGWFYKVIQKYVPVSISCYISHKTVQDAQNRICIDDVHSFRYRGDLFDLLFKGLVKCFNDTRGVIDETIPLNEPVDFIFDNHSKKRRVLDNWDRWIESMGQDARKRYGSTPRFESDETFLPLQAADFWAWWIREGCEAGDPTLLFDRFPMRQGKLDLYVTMTVDNILEHFANLIREQHGADRKIIDVLTGSRL